MDIEEYRQKHWTWKILLFDVSVFAGGALIGLVIFTILFLVLNYFNLISLSTIYKPFALLPRQQPKTNLQRNSPLQNSLPKLTPSPTVFQYDVEKAQTLLTQYIKDIIKPEFLPDKIIINQGQQIDGVKSNLPYEFGWYQPGVASFGATLHFVENTNTIDDKDIFIEIKSNSLKETSITASLANSLLTQYLQVQEPIQPTDCKTIPNASFCQVFKQDSNGKNGLGILLLGKGALSVTQKPHLILFSCSLSKEGNTYKTQQSCLRGF